MLFFTIVAAIYSGVSGIHLGLKTRLLILNGASNRGTRLLHFQAKRDADVRN